MSIELIFDTDKESTVDRLKELQQKGVTFTAKPAAEFELIPAWTRFYKDGFETCLANLNRIGILASNGGLIGDKVLSQGLDFVLYSALHQQHYFFKRDADFTQSDEKVIGSLVAAK